MKRFPVDKTEMELRRDKDFLAAKKMIGEGGPVHEYEQKDEENKDIDAHPHSKDDLNERD